MVRPELVRGVPLLALVGPGQGKFPPGRKNHVRRVHDETLGVIKAEKARQKYVQVMSSNPQTTQDLGGQGVGFLDP